VLLETNGYGLTPENLDLLRDAGLDAFWLDIKALDPERHRWLTGCDNDRILKLPEAMLARGFVLEVLSLVIPGVVEADQIGGIAELLAAVDPEIPFTLLAFFPAYRMQDVPAPTVAQMVRAWEAAVSKGLRRIRLGNLGVFVRSDADLATLEAHVDPDAW